MKILMFRDLMKTFLSLNNTSINDNGKCISINYESKEVNVTVNGKPSINISNKRYNRIDALIGPKPGLTFYISDYDRVIHNDTIYKKRNLYLDLIRVFDDDSMFLEKVNSIFEMEILRHGYD